MDWLRKILEFSKVQWSKMTNKEYIQETNGEDVSLYETPGLS